MKQTLSKKHVNIFQCQKIKCQGHKVDYSIALLVTILLQHYEKGFRIERRNTRSSFTVKMVGCMKQTFFRIEQRNT